MPCGGRKMSYSAAYIFSSFEVTEFILVTVDSRYLDLGYLE